MRPLIEEFVLNLLVDADHPALGAERTILEVIDLGLKLDGAILGLAKLQRQLVSEIEGAVAIFLGGAGGLIEKADDGLARTIDLIVVSRPFLFIRCERNDLLWPVECALNS